jgi:hypothetical protein
MAVKTVSGAITALRLVATRSQPALMVPFA